MSTLQPPGSHWLDATRSLSALRCPGDCPGNLSGQRRICCCCCFPTNLIIFQLIWTLQDPRPCFPQCLGKEQWALPAGTTPVLFSVALDIIPTEGGPKDPPGLRRFACGQVLKKQWSGSQKSLPFSVHPFATGQGPGWGTMEPGRATPPGHN